MFSVSISILAVTVLVAPAETDLVDRIERLQLQNGLFLDRASDVNTVSAAATGLGSLALAEAAVRGEVDRTVISDRLESAFQLTLAANPSRNRGWLSHFTDSAGVPKRYSEVSTIDTALFYLGMIRAAELLELRDLSRRIKEEFNRIDVSFVLRDGQFLHGFYWDDDPAGTQSAASPRFILYRWNDSSEGVILYKLFEREFAFTVRRVDYPLFVYLYPLIFYDDPVYEILVSEALEYQQREFGHMGFTATDGPTGYTATDTNLISPLLLSAVASRFPQALETIRKHALDPSIAAYYIPDGWVAPDELAIDLASAYLLLVKWRAYQERRVEPPVLPALPGQS